MTGMIGLQNRIAREATEAEFRARLYANTPPGKFTRQMRRQMERGVAKADLSARKKACKAKGGAACVK